MITSFPFSKRRPCYFFLSLVSYFLIVIGAIPLNASAAKPADFNGDGKSDLAVWRPTEGNWYVYTADSSGPSHICPPNFTYYGFGGCVAQWGLPGDTPRPADFDGDNKVDLAVWRPNTQTWWIKLSQTGNIWQIPLSAYGVQSVDIADAADTSGDGLADILMLRRIPSSIFAYWIGRNTATQTVTWYHADLGATPLQNPLVTLSGFYDSNFFTGVATRYEHSTANYMTWARTRLTNNPSTSVFNLLGNFSAAYVATKGEWGGVVGNLLDYTQFQTADGGWFICSSYDLI